MIYGHLIRTPSPASYLTADPAFYSAVVTGTSGTDTIIDILHLSDPTIPGDTLIGARDQAGEHTAPFNLNEYLAIRPLVNQPAVLDEDGNEIARAGLGTGNLGYHSYTGWELWKIGTDGNLYPDDHAPFYVECRLIHDPVYGYAPRYEVQLESQDISAIRDPGQRSFYRFSSSECIYPSEFISQLGALQIGDSLWHTDENGNPLEVWFSEDHTTYKPTREAVHFALYESAWREEGRYTLPEGAESVRVLLWQDTAGVPPGGTWQATSMVVTAQYGTVYELNQDSTLIEGESIRYGAEDGPEAVFTQTQAGFPDRIETDPFVDGQVGQTIWRLQNPAQPSAQRNLPVDAWQEWDGNIYFVDASAETVTYTPVTSGLPTHTLGIAEFLTTEVIELDFRRAVWMIAVLKGLSYPEPQAANGWTSSGATITAQYGTVYKIDQPLSLIPGEIIRFDDGGPETTFIGLRPGFSDQILTGIPFITGQVGKKIYWKR